MIHDASKLQILQLCGHAESYQYDPICLVANGRMEFLLVSSCLGMRLVNLLGDVWIGFT